MRRRRVLRIAMALVFMVQMLLAINGPLFAGTTGIISGMVTDDATGEKLAGVNVVVEGTNLTTVTDSNGYYVITNVPPGDHRVTASLVGYTDTQEASVSVLMDVKSTVDLAMPQAVEDSEEVIVTERRPMIQKDIVPTMYVVDQSQEKMIQSQPNLIYQTPAVVATQPGVVPDEGGYPHIRGGRANQVGYMLEGIPITEPVTNGFGTNVVTVGMDKMEMFTGGYRPEYGNAISGVFNQVVKTGRTAPGLSMEMIGGAQAYRGFYPQLGGVTEKGLDYYVGSFVWHSEFERMQFNEADCSDVIGKFTYPMGQKNKLSLLTTAGRAKYLFPSSHTETWGPTGLITVPEERDHQHQAYALTALSLTHTVNSKSFLTVRPYYFRNTWTVDAISDAFGFWWQGESATTGLTIDYTNQISPKHLVKAGAIRMSASNSYHTTTPAYGTYEYFANTDTMQTGLYMQDQMTLSDRWNAELGLRYDRMHYDKVENPDTSESQLSPRCGLSYSVDSKTRLRCSWGKMIQFVYSQAIERDYVDPSWDWYLANADLKPERSTQFDFGWEREVSKDYLVQITPFYRKFTDMLQTRLLDPDNPDASPVIFDNLGEGATRGVEFLVRKRASKNWSGWFAYTLSKARAQSSNDREMLSSPAMQYVDWDQRHTAVLVLNYTNRDWNYSLMGEYGSGLPYTLGTELPNQHRVNPHTTINLNVSREIKGGWLPQGTMYLSVANLFNAGYTLKRDTTGAPSASVTPRFVSMGYVRRF